MVFMSLHLKEIIMGTDIHYRFEAKVKPEEGQLTTPQDISPWQTIETEYAGGRNYLLFAVLAGVRNGYGFGGSYHHEPIIPIAEDRGIPPDVIDNDDGWEFGDHSHTWVLGSEIMEWVKTDRMLIHCGVITRKAFQVWDGKAPDTYSGNVWGGNTYTIDDLISAKNVGCVLEELPIETGLAVVEQETVPWTHIRVWWVNPINESLSSFLDIIRKLMEEHGEIRMIMGFDS